jgi:[ribosomal protein S5]-alanine N-acetyltransferase
MQMMIETNRLLLRRARLDDAAEMHEILSNEGAMRYWSSPPHYEFAQTQAWIADMAAATADTSEDFIIEVDGKVAGKVGAYRLPEFGYILHPDLWGRGIATEAVRAFLRHIWQSRPDVAALTTDIDPRNTASLRLVETLGFRETGRAEQISADASDGDRKVVLDLLSHAPVPVDEIIRQSSLSPATVQTVLLELELAGRLERHAGAKVSLG